MKDFRRDKTQPIPKWFNGIILEHSEVVTNQFTGLSIELNPLEVAIYDLGRGAEMIASGLPHEDLQEPLFDIVRKCNSWFISNNSRAYMILID